MIRVPSSPSASPPPWFLLFHCLTRPLTLRPPSGSGAPAVKSLAESVTVVFWFQRATRSEAGRARRRRALTSWRHLEQSRSLTLVSSLSPPPPPLLLSSSPPPLLHLLHLLHLLLHLGLLHVVDLRLELLQLPLVPPLVLEEARVLLLSLLQLQEVSVHLLETLLVVLLHAAGLLLRQVGQVGLEVGCEGSEVRGQPVEEVRGQRSGGVGQDYGGGEDQRSEIRDQRSKIRDQRSEIKDQRLEIRD
ncbi:hypothetical protein EYF80_050555 [Liparis tanakae]|uniref:Uncharacterized protein n=1 Tax=Liparis tanakae TaxID=230148 RepID=A0A4Z2FDH8_9TELE|nr:hypothetical protein EYF80_050555 [Liparis tanakae]